MNYDIVKTMKAIVNYYDETRGVGHSARVINGVLSDTILCGATKKSARQVFKNFKSRYENRDGRHGRDIRSVTSLRALDGDLLRGMLLPLVFDNGAIRELCAMALKRIAKKERKPRDPCKDCWLRWRA